MNNQQLNNRTEEDEVIDFNKIFSKVVSKWPFFILSIILCLAVSFLYLKYVPPVYQIQARMLVEDDEKGGGLGKQFGDLMDMGGLLGSQNSVDNEAEVLKTRFLMEQVVRDMQLNITYHQDNSLTSHEIYTSPFKVIILNSVDTIRTTKITIEKSGKNTFNLKTKYLEREVKLDEPFFVKKVGTLKIVNNPSVKFESAKYSFKIYSIDKRVTDLMEKFTVGIVNKQVSVIDMGFSYPIPKKGEDILNVLIAKYRSANLEDKNAIADSTSKFIKERLTVIASELGDVENKVEDFKQRNSLADMSEQGKVLVQNTGEFASELAKAETQVAIMTDLENYMKDENKNKRVFPSSLFPQDMVFSGLLNQYNALLLERDKQLLSVTEESPFIKNIDKQILEMRQGILANIQNSKNTFVQSRNKLRGQLNKAEGKISGVPQIEKNYLKLARNREIKQELYIFLMQKAEETAISKTSNISVAKVIDPPKANIDPISPKKNVVYLCGFLIGFILPLAYIFIGELLKTSITAKEDISSRTQIPIVGEISHNLSQDNLIIANQSRSAISEQFRALRTNLGFYLTKSTGNTILLTSSMSGEGKSFTAINLANILALSGKKVLLMELDLRKPGLSAKLKIENKFGFTNYTIDPSTETKKLIKPLDIHANMFIISSGPLPPNPAETLMNDNVPKLISELKDQYDYIIMDAPPVGIITDAQLLANYADVTLYLVRHNVTQKDQLKIVDELYRSGKMKNLGIVVNDIISKLYGYGYGYGNYGEQMQAGFLQRIRNKFTKN